MLTRRDYQPATHLQELIKQTKTGVEANRQPANTAGATFMEQSTESEVRGWTYGI